MPRIRYSMTSKQPSNAAERILRVLMTSTSYPSTLEDWRGVFIRHLAESVARRNDIRVELWAPPGPCKGHVIRTSREGENRRLSRLMQNGGIAHLLRTRPLLGVIAGARLLYDLHSAYRRSDCDIYHVNWLQCAIPLPADKKPLLVTVLGSDMQFLRLPGVKSMLRRTFRSRSVAICPNADWMQPELERRFADVARIVPVPFGIDPCWFELERKRPPGQTPEWLAVTRLTRAKLGTLLEWCEPLFSGTHRELHLIGPMQESITLPDWIHYHGPASPKELCEKWFPKATGLITLSQHAEGRPQVMLEAMAAAIPIIASRLPAHETIVRDNQTGFIVDDASQLASRMERVEDPETGSKLGLQARKEMRGTPGTWDDAADRFQAIYLQLLENQAP